MQQPLELGMDQEQRSSDHVSLRILGDELPDQELPLSYLEVQNLLAIEEDPLLKLALANWKEKERLFSSRIFDRRRRIERTKYVVYQVVGIYFVFQGLNLLIAISKGACEAGPMKESRLYLIFLSLAASLLTILVITKKLKTISILEKTCWSEEQSLKVVVRSRLELARSGKNYEFKDHSYSPKPPRYSFVGHYVMDYGAMFVLCNTAWVFPLGVWRISK